MLFLLGPEEAHEVARRLSRLFPTEFLAPLTRYQSSRLETSIGSVPLANPIGLAAGFDKNGDMINLAKALGFGFTEIGSITQKPCAGNPKPRLIRLPKDFSLINRLGLPNWGVKKIVEHLEKTKPSLPVGLNIAKTPARGTEKREGVSELMATFKALKGEGDYFVFNLSCPNTADGKTFEDPENFVELAKAVVAARRDLDSSRPVLLKLSPDLPKKVLKTLVEKGIEFGFDGFVLSNSTIKREVLKTDPEILSRFGQGGLTGAALKGAANDQLGSVFEMVGTRKILVAVGGILGVADLLEKLALGGALFQVYTGLVYGGPLFVKRLCRGLDAWCQKEGVKNFRELVGSKDLAATLSRRGSFSSA